MSKDCFVTTFKKSTTAELPKLGTFKVPVLPYDSLAIRVVTPNAGDSQIKVFDSSGVYIKTINSVISSSSTYTNLGIPGGGYYEVVNKYPVISGFVSNFTYENREKLSKISELFYNSGLTELSYRCVDGSMADAAKIDSVVTIEGTYFTGDVLDFVNVKRERGFMSGNITLNFYSNIAWPDSFLTFNGVTIRTNSWQAPTNGLHWETGKVYLLSDNGATVRTYGYTDEEIETMRQSGGVFQNVTLVIKVD